LAIYIEQNVAINLYPILNLKVHSNGTFFRKSSKRSGGQKLPAKRGTDKFQTTGVLSGEQHASPGVRKSFMKGQEDVKTLLTDPNLDQYSPKCLDQD
jgi:hypothetical protein